MKLAPSSNQNTMKLIGVTGALGTILSLSAPSPAQSAAGAASADATAPASVPAASVPSPAAVPYIEKYKPEKNVWEIGLFGGLMFPSSSHELVQPDKIGARYSEFNTAGEVGFRLAYLPFEFVGAEVEAAGMPTSEKNGGKAGLFAARAHVVGQLPGYSVTPFALLGMGLLGASSDTMGTDVDPAVHFGIGAKAALDEYLSVRLDLRDTMHQKYKGSSGSQTHSPEVLLGVTFTLERRTPDSDGDGVADFRDKCPAVPGPENGCPPPAPAAPPAPCPEPAAAVPAPSPAPIPAPADADGDGVPDSADKCPAVPAQTEDGCPGKDVKGGEPAPPTDKTPQEK